MERKILFFDIDGTLLDATGTIPASAKEALRLAREKGHITVICSGRARCQIGKNITDGFDAIISCTGANVEYHGETIAKHTLSREQLTRMIAYFEKHNASYMLQAAERLITPSKLYDEYAAVANRPRGSVDALQNILRYLEQYDDMLNSVDGLLDTEKACYFLCETEPEHLQAGIGDDLFREEMSYDKPNPHMGEITLRDCTKATGMKELMEHLGVSEEDTVAFGDGPNDKDMIQFAHIGVAMGNGREELKEMADYVTTAVDEDGIYNAMKALELI